MIFYLAVQLQLGLYSQKGENKWMVFGNNRKFDEQDEIIRNLQKIIYDLTLVIQLRQKRTEKLLNFRLTLYNY